MPSLDSERPFDRWNTTRTCSRPVARPTVTGRQADLKGLQTPECLRFFDRGEEDWNPWAGEPSPSRMRRQCM